MIEGKEMQWLFSPPTIDDIIRLLKAWQGGWHFYADDKNPGRASALASLWAQTFVEQVRAQVATTNGLNSFIEANVTQITQLPVERSVSLSTYLFVGAIAFLAFGSFLILFVSRSK